MKKIDFILLYLAIFILALLVFVDCSDIIFNKTTYSVYNNTGYPLYNVIGLYNNNFETADGTHMFGYLANNQQTDEVEFKYDDLTIMVYISHDELCMVMGKYVIPENKHTVISLNHDTKIYCGED